MRSEQEAEMDGFNKGINMQIDFRFWTYLLVGGLGFLLGLAWGLLA